MARRGSSQATKLAELKRNTQVIEMVTSGKSHSVVAALVGVSVGRISQIISEARAEWTVRREIAAEDQIDVSLTKLDEIYNEARLGWERSYQDAVTLTTKKSLRTPKISKKVLARAKAQLVTTNQDEVRKGQAGDPAFLQVMKNVADTRLKLLNAFPKEDKTEINNIVQFDFSQFTNPIPCEVPIQLTPADEVEARIAQESKVESPKNNSNGNGKAH